MQQERRAKRRNVPAGVDRVIDEYGVVLSETPKYRQVAVKEKARYASMYLNDETTYDAMRGLGNFGSVWGFVLIHYNKDNAMFYFSKSVRDETCRVTGLSDGTVRSAINSFCDSNLLLKIRNAEYMVNPTHFYMGTWENRAVMIENYDDKRLARVKLEAEDRIDAKTVKL